MEQLHVSHKSAELHLNEWGGRGYEWVSEPLSGQGFPKGTEEKGLVIWTELGEKYT